MFTQYPIFHINHFDYNKELNMFTAKFRNLPCDPIPYKEFIIRNPKTQNEATFILISNIHDEDARTCGWRFMASYESVEQFPALKHCFVDILLD